MNCLGRIIAVTAALMAGCASVFAQPVVWADPLEVVNSPLEVKVLDFH